MLQLKCTRKVQKYLGLRPGDLPEPKPPDTLLGHWYVNLFFVDRRKTLLFMSERTLLSFILFGVRKDHAPEFPVSFLRGLDQLLASEGFGVDEIDRVLLDYQMFQCVPTASQRGLGNMRDLMLRYKDDVYREGGLKNCDLGSIISKMNDMPQRNLGWASSSQVTRDLLLNDGGHGPA